MSNDELLKLILDSEIRSNEVGQGGWKALRAVVELHEPIRIDSDVPNWCTESCGSYPCNTIQAIEKELK